MQVPNAATVENLTQAEVDNRDFQDILAAGFALTGVVSGCAVTAQSTPNMTLAVAAGTIITGGVTAAITAGNVTVTAADLTSDRFDLVCVDSAGIKSVVAGTPAAAHPSYPDPAGKVVLTAVRVPAAIAAINAAKLVDKRVIIGPITGTGAAVLSKAPTLTGQVTINPPAATAIGLAVLGVAGQPLVTYLQSAAGQASYLELGLIEIESDTAGNLLVSHAGIAANVFYSVAAGAVPTTLVLNAGKVGIGVGTPTTGLDIQTAPVTSRGNVQIIDTTAMAAGVGGAITMGGKYNAAGAATPGIMIGAAKTNATSGDYSFDTVFLAFQTGAGTMTERMRIKGDNGYTGIGTNAPQFPLQVNGGMAAYEGGNCYAMLGIDPASAASPNTFASLYYDNTNHVARIDCLSGGVAWRPLVLNADAPGTPVGIGTLTPHAQLELSTNNPGAETEAIRLTNLGGGTGVGMSMKAYSNTVEVGRVRWAYDGTNWIMQLGVYPSLNQIYFRGDTFGIGGINVARAYRAAAQNLASGPAWTKILIDTVTLDPGANFDVATNHRYNVPTTGYYQVSGNVALNNNASGASIRYIAAVYVNGVERARGDQQAVEASNDFMGLSVHDILQLNAADYVELYAYNGSPTIATLDFSSFCNRLAIVRVG